jgi:aspartate aminotransferase-like enzyme
MLLTLENFLRATGVRRSLHRAPNGSGEVAPAKPVVNLLPGPIAVSARVLATFNQSPISHRAPEFMDLLGNLRRRLAALVRAPDVQVMPGSGSLANDIVAAQLATLRSPGVVISSGEFGERLAEHANRAGLEFHWARLPWGTPLTEARLEHAISATAAPKWLWMVHHETSTGVLHDLAAIKALARERSLALCLDCTSTIGAIEVDLGGVQFATTTSAKGLGAMPGLALVFHDTLPPPRADLPRYLDLGLWAISEGAPFTHSSNLVAALDVALAEIERLPAGGRCAGRDDAAWLRAELRSAGFAVVADEAHASSIIITVALPPDVNAAALGEELERRGFLASHRSGYLARRNWIQFCLISAPPRDALAALLTELRSLAGPVNGHAATLFPCAQPSPIAAET